MVYLDYISIFSCNVEKHIDNVETVLTLIQNAGLTIKLKKCLLMNDSFEYLSCIVKRNKL